jgi:hypothetical protein
VEVKKLSELTLAIRAIGFTPSAFAEEKLGISYQLFRYRVRKGRLTLEDYWKILHLTGKTFENLFPNPSISKPRPISLTLTPKARLTPAPVERVEPEKKPVPPPPVVEKPVPVSAPIDVYGGLPPLDEE